MTSLIDGLYRAVSPYLNSGTIALSFLIPIALTIFRRTRKLGLILLLIVCALGFLLILGAMDSIADHLKA